MKVYYRKRHVKTIPKRFKCIPNICDHFEELETTRLSENERRLLDVELCRNEIEQLKEKQHPAIREQIKGARVVAATAVHTKHSDYTVLNFSSGIELRCSQELFNAFPFKRRINRLY